MASATSESPNILEASKHLGRSRSWQCESEVSRLRLQQEDKAGPSDLKTIALVGLQHKYS